MVSRTDSNANKKFNTVQGGVCSVAGALLPAKSRVPLEVRAVQLAEAPSL